MGDKIRTMEYLNSTFPDLKNVQDDNMDNALILAAASGNIASIKYLLNDLKFDVDFKGDKGRNCYLVAAWWGKLKTFEYLHRKYPHLRESLDNDGKTALDLAKERGKSNIVTFL